MSPISKCYGSEFIWCPCYALACHEYGIFEVFLLLLLVFRCCYMNIHCLGCLIIMKSFFVLRNLESLTLGRDQVGDGFFHALADCSMLKRLDVHDATLGNGAQEILINHDQLCHLELIKCQMMRVSVRWSNFIL